MAGVRQFDDEAVLDRLIAAFWEGGYEATSIDDLVAATGLKRGSLYNAFGDKEAMYLKAVTRYGEIVSSETRAALAQDDPGQGLRRYLEAHIARMSQGQTPRGCMMVAACVELGGRPGMMGRVGALGFSQLEDELVEALRRWQSCGTIRPDRDVADLGRFLATLLRGMAVAHRATDDLSAARASVAVALETLEAWLVRA